MQKLVSKHMNKFIMGISYKGPEEVKIYYPPSPFLSASNVLSSANKLTTSITTSNLISHAPRGYVSAWKGHRRCKQTAIAHRSLRQSAEKTRKQRLDLLIRTCDSQHTCHSARLLVARPPVCWAALSFLFRAPSNSMTLAAYFAAPVSSWFFWPITGKL